MERNDILSDGSFELVKTEKVNAALKWGEICQPYYCGEFKEGYRVVRSDPEDVNKTIIEYWTK